MESALPPASSGSRHSEWLWFWCTVVSGWEPDVKARVLERFGGSAVTRAKAAAGQVSPLRLLRKFCGARKLFSERSGGGVHARCAGVCLRSVRAAALRRPRWSRS